MKWLTAELAKDWHLDDVSDDNYCFAIALILCQTRHRPPPPNDG